MPERFNTFASGMSSYSSRFLFSIFILLLPVALLRAQGDNNRILNIQFLYNYQTPGGDWARRFDTNHGMGVGLLYKPESNWIVSAEWNYLFGTEVKETSVLYYLTNSSGMVNDNSGAPADLVWGMRGWSTFFKAGKLFPLFPGSSKNHGVLLQAGAGYFSHRINFSLPQNNVASLSEDYIKGYDRLSAGYAFNGFAGYYFHSRNRFINFYAGVDFSRAFTTSLRGYNYDRMAADTKTYTDDIFALRLGWMIPLYLSGRSDDEFHFE